jgi:hypothetical protein
MKHSRFKDFNFSDSNLLSKEQMKMITGGNESVGGTACLPNGHVCATVDGVVYRCANIPGGPSGGDEECCCGHSRYNEMCQS